MKQWLKEQLAALSIKNYRIDDLLVVPAAETNPQEEIIQTLAKSVEPVTGARPRLEGSGPACDGCSPHEAFRLSADMASNAEACMVQMSGQIWKFA